MIVAVLGLAFGASVGGAVMAMAVVALVGVLNLWEVVAVVDCSSSCHCCQYCGCFGPLEGHKA